jgi:hypothetical protein
MHALARKIEAPFLELFPEGVQTAVRIQPESFNFLPVVGLGILLVEYAKLFLSETDAADAIFAAFQIDPKETVVAVTAVVHVRTVVEVLAHHRIEHQL